MNAINASTELGFGHIPSLEQRVEPTNTTHDYIKAILPKLAKWQIEEITATVRKHYMARYKNNTHKPKYGNLNKGFTEQELQAFMHVINNPKHKLLFQYQAALGLRIGEAVEVRIQDINFETRELTVRTEKNRTLDRLLIPIPLFKATIDFIQGYSKDIEASGGWLFFADLKKSIRGASHIEQNYARNEFRLYIKLAGLDEVYDLSDEQDGRTVRKLHRLTTHSLRHYAITKFARSTNGNLILTSRFARHSDPAVTTTYINTDRKEIYDVIDSISLSSMAGLKRRLGVLG